MLKNCIYDPINKCDISDIYYDYYIYSIEYYEYSIFMITKRLLSNDVKRKIVYRAYYSSL